MRRATFGNHGSNAPLSQGLSMGFRVVAPIAHRYCSHRVGDWPECLAELFVQILAEALYASSVICLSGSDAVLEN